MWWFSFPDPGGCPPAALLQLFLWSFWMFVTGLQVLPPDGGWRLFSFQLLDTHTSQLSPLEESETGCGPSGTLLVLLHLFFMTTFMTATGLFLETLSSARGVWTHGGVDLPHTLLSHTQCTEPRRKSSSHSGARQPNSQRVCSRKHSFLSPGRLGSFQASWFLESTFLRTSIMVLPRPSWLCFADVCLLTPKLTELSEMWSKCC